MPTDCNLGIYIHSLKNVADWKKDVYGISMYNYRHTKQNVKVAFMTDILLYTGIILLVVGTYHVILERSKVVYFKIGVWPTLSLDEISNDNTSDDLQIKSKC